MEAYPQHTMSTLASLTTLQVEPTRPEDAEAILAIARDVGVFNTEEIAAVDELLHAYFEQGPETSGYYFLSCRTNGRVLGFACYGPRPLAHGTYDLYWIATDKTAQHWGIGGALFQHVIEAIRALGGRMLVIETSGLPQYEPARHFYESHGCSRAGVIADFYAPGDDLVIYVRHL